MMVGKVKKHTERFMSLYNKTICEICKDKKGKLSQQYCLDNEKHPTYEERYDCWDGLTYLDCWSFIRSNESKQEWKNRVFKKIYYSSIS